MKEENNNSLVNSLGEKLSNNFKIEKEEFEKPKLKVIDIDMDLVSEEEIEHDINKETSITCKTIARYCTFILMKERIRKLQ